MLFTLGQMQVVKLLTRNTKTCLDSLDHLDSLDCLDSHDGLGYLAGLDFLDSLGPLDSSLSIFCYRAAPIQLQWHLF